MFQKQSYKQGLFFLLLLAYIFVIFNPDITKPIFAAFAPNNKDVIYQNTSFSQLLGNSHLLLTD